MQTSISDDPTTWIVPKEAGQFPSIVDWWDHLRAIDDELHKLGRQGAAVDEIDFLVEQARLNLARIERAVQVQADLRQTVLALVVEHQLDLDVVARLIGFEGFTARTIMSILSPSGANRDDDEAKVQAVALLRAGRSITDAAAGSGLADHQVRYLSYTLKIDTPHAQALPSDLRTEALRLLSDGLSSPEVGERLGLSAATVRTWARRERLAVAA